MLWQVDIHPAPGQPDRAGCQVAADAADLAIAPSLGVVTAYGYLLQGNLDAGQVALLSRDLFADGVVERTTAAHCSDAVFSQPPPRAARVLRGEPLLVYVLPRPGVMDPVAQSAVQAVADFGLRVDAVRSYRKYWLDPLPADKLRALCSKVLSNEAIEQVVIGPLLLDRLELGSAYDFRLKHVALSPLDDEGLKRLSVDGQLYLKLPEMQAIRDHYCALGRDPTDAELETIAQTWSEHCSHKTLTGRVDYQDERGRRHFDNLLKETIFAATEQIRRQLGNDDWCVSVFRDNAGVVRFDDRNHVVFKVETHNHPSALEPYGGANTGIGGVIRDPLGTGLGARPVCNTDVFCFAQPDMPLADLPPGVLHPKRVMKGVVAGVRDYGNRMGIPTVNGAIYFDPRYLGNPLVFCGTVGLLPCDRVEKSPCPGDHIVAVGGRTGRDGIHGATFSSAELTSESEQLSGGAVQIGNAITEKMLLDVILQARDRGLYTAITDCGAGGFSSAVGEMGAEIGAEVWLDQIPLKYEGLSYTEIWISEAQERMVLAVPPDNWPQFAALCESEGVEATIIGRFVPTGRLELKYAGTRVADLAMDFLHKGRPKVVRQAIYAPRPVRPLAAGVAAGDHTATLLAILGSLNVASKEWVIRQYDHEVQGGSVVKPLVGAANDGPSDAAVLRPDLASRRGIVLAVGMNPRYGDLDTYCMAASAIDEAVRNCVAVGADPDRIAILDNFCWGDTDQSETLGSLVRAALACHDVAIALGTPFISGKDSLNNEFRYTAADGSRVSIAVPPSLLISALGQIADVRRAVTMDLKEPGNFLYQVGWTLDELAGSHWALVATQGPAAPPGRTRTGSADIGSADIGSADIGSADIGGAETSGAPIGGTVPAVDAAMARRTFQALHRAIHQGLIRACHDLSEGGLAVAAAEMAFAGGLGAALDVRLAPQSEGAPGGAALGPVSLLFSESNSRFLCEVPPAAAAAFETLLKDVPHARVGQVAGTRKLEIRDGRELLISAELDRLKQAWQRPLAW